MSRVFRTRNGHVVVNGPMNLSVRKRRVAKPGRVVAFAEKARRREKQNLGHGLPRDHHAVACVDALAAAALDAEASRRRLTHSGLIGTLLETIIEDDLFDAILGEEVGRCKP
jgi:hypothetical protein